MEKINLTLTGKEASAVFFALSVNAKGEARTFAFKDLGPVAEVSSELAPAVKAGSEGVTSLSESVSVSLSRAAMDLIVACVSELSWRPADSQAVLSLVEKLK